MKIIDRIAARFGYSKARRSRRAFEGAQISRLTDSWITSVKPIDVDIRRGLRVLRTRSREQAQNNDYVRQFLRLVKTNVVGPQGIVMQARALGRSGKLDKPANNAIEDAWLEWGAHGTPEVTGIMSWKQLKKLVIETVARDGEALLRKVRNWDGNRFRYALQVLDPEILDVDYNRDLGNGNVIKMGVELNEWRRPVAYHLLTTKQTADTYAHTGRRYHIVPADEIIHLFLPEWAWQTRGIPFIATALLRLNMLHGYEEAELVASRAAASKMGFYQQHPDAIGPGPDVTEQDSDGNFIQDAEAGTFEKIPAGWTFESWDPQHPNAAFSAFVKTVQRAFASGLGVSYHALTGDLEGANYSSLREGKLLDKDVWMSLQDWFIEAFCMPVFKDWMTIQHLAQTITVNSKPLRGPLQKYQRVSWQPRRWQWVDPQKEMQANREAYSLRTRSISEIIRDQGRDPDEVWEEMARDKERMIEHGIPLPVETNISEPKEEGADDAKTETD